MEPKSYSLHTTQTQVLLFWNGKRRSSLSSIWRSGQPEGSTFKGHKVEIKILA
jgi:hypothetical protein